MPLGKPGGTEIECYISAAGLCCLCKYVGREHKIPTIKKNTLNDPSKEAGLEVNAEKTNMLLSRHQNAGQHHNMEI
jgi:hypothetical protein